MDARVKSIFSEFRRGLEAIYAERLVDVVLFGSQARGDARSDSDIDVLVVLSGEVQPYTEISHSSRLVADLSLRYDTVLSSVFASEERYRAAASPLLRSVRREGIRV